MSTYLSWQTDEGLEDAGQVETWDVARAWALVQRPGPLKAMFRQLAAGRAIEASRLEPALAECFASTLLAEGEDIDPDLWAGLTQLLDAIISRPPGRKLLVVGTDPEKDFDPPQLVEWIAQMKDEWDSWPDSRRQRLALLMKTQSLMLDTEPQDEDFTAKAVELVACLQLLPHYPA